MQNNYPQGSCSSRQLWIIQNSSREIIVTCSQDPFAAPPPAQWDPPRGALCRPRHPREEGRQKVWCLAVLHKEDEKANWRVSSATRMDHSSFPFLFLFKNRFERGTKTKEIQHTQSSDYPPRAFSFLTVTYIFVITVEWHSLFTFTSLNNSLGLWLLRCSFSRGKT